MATMIYTASSCGEPSYLAELISLHTPARSLRLSDDSLKLVETRGSYFTGWKKVQLCVLKDLESASPRRPSENISTKLTGCFKNISVRQHWKI